MTAALIIVIAVVSFLLGAMFGHAGIVGALRKSGYAVERQADKSYRI